METLDIQQHVPSQTQDTDIYPCTLYLLTPTHTLSLPVESHFLPPIPLFQFPFHLVIPMYVHTAHAQ